MFTVKDSGGEVHQVVAEYADISGDFVYFFNDAERVLVAAFYKPIFVIKGVT